MPRLEAEPFTGPDRFRQALRAGAVGSVDSPGLTDFIKAFRPGAVRKWAFTRPANSVENSDLARLEVCLSPGQTDFVKTSLHAKVGIGSGPSPGQANYVANSELARLEVCHFSGPDGFRQDLTACQGWNRGLLPGRTDFVKPCEPVPGLTIVGRRGSQIGRGQISGVFL
jgi:hypothetical protein